MKRIVFDLTKTQPQLCHNSKYHGGGKYGIAVFRKLSEMAPERLIAYYNDELYINDEIIKIIQDKNITVYYVKDISIFDLVKNNDSIIYSPIFDKEYIQHKSVFVYTTIHDIRNLILYSDQYMFSYRTNISFVNKVKRFIGTLATPLFIKYKKRKALRFYDSIFKCKQLQFVTVSQFSKYAILSHFPYINTNDINVYYSPSSICNEELSDKPKQYGKYWLIVSGNRWVKNSIRAIIAFDKLFSEHPNLNGNVVITGLQSLKDLKIHVNNKSRFICIGYVSERELKSLYHYAYAFVYPTLSEGFGYPPLEAMHESCPVICSAVASIPEICGDAALYFNPYSVSEIATRIFQFENEALRNEYAMKGKARQALIESKQNSDLAELCRGLLESIDTFAS